MQLTLHADYSLRVLIYLAANRGRLVSTMEISRAYGISANHLVKVVLNLSKHGYVRSRRGRTGGSELAREPEEINIGEVVRQLEPDFRIVECFDPMRNSCPIDQVCGLKSVLRDAGEAFVAVLERYTLGDVMTEDECRVYEAFFLPLAR
jgi:Rrf2 family transcriptional regulator, nitric oxide-sensitive transcriptional repressor